MTTASRLVLAAALAVFAARAAATTHQDALDEVRQLYAAAQYERALSALQRLKEEPGTTSGTEIDRYRALCLMALGRSKDADAAIESILTIDPLYRPPANETSPAVRSAFATVRQRLLPALARTLYADGREAFGRRSYLEAASKFERTLRLLRDVDIAGSAPATSGGTPLVDVRILADGFLQLSRAALGQPVAPPGEALTEPVPVQQEMPQWTFALASAFYEPSLRAVVELEIDVHGDVLSAEVIQSSHPQYNSVLAKTAQGWKYEPARRNGQPVKTRHRVEVVLKPR